MIKLLKKSILLYVFALLTFSFSYPTSYIEAQSSNQSKKQIKYKKARALQSKTAKKMAKVYEALEEVDDKGEPAPDMELVVEILTELRNDQDNLKSYDRSVVWNSWGYVYFTDGKYNEAIRAYERVINEPEVTLPIRNAALFTLAQLNLVQEKYDEGIELILQWMDQVETVTAQSWSLLGQAYFQKEDFNKSMSSMKTAISLAEEEGYKPKENWYVIVAACIGELKKQIGEKESLLQQLDIYEILVNLYPKKLYFIQLGGTYGQLGREKDYMITMKAAHAKDFLNKESEYLALTQLLLLNQNPYWAAQVLVSGQNKIITYTETVLDKNTGKEVKVEKTGPVVKDNEKNLKLLADSWRMAQEVDKAIPVLEKAAVLSKDGKAYVLLGNLYLGEDRMQEAVDAIKKGLKKGKIEKLSQVHLTLGQAYFELQKFEEAKKEFRIAARDKDKKVKTTANSWIKYTENEEIRVKSLALRRDYIQSQS
ncbi:tetratricopeptide repeat protein [Gammaproteobacteria bacterium]|jgi:tetratricopeptide (TPR) repeat protein|nr:tetratricopeptide repeat protein [Gammaproteobacteria bacterium]MDC0405613.1 tetratricopeptide repeat protein [Gammaproteobacteria bacterium]MDC0536090.1 tetratricopeptide repeat protein [Gammaproteobacteria bacterium]MDC1149149.1 tetratricopeptide repeat protein [Gammaproteobacteria bacterium]MDC1170748.1 tetratricopeptide repeat protein [Gammaproteobacteria bacterium]|tara:strand:- start:301 stop:1743 length:1443 start_codon:yes stop_codon:yes gene_type:complete